jgi:hypothetical protein
MDKEIWKDIPDYEGYYQISNYGRVKSLSRFQWNGFKKWKSKEKMLKYGIGTSGYYFIILCKNSITTNKMVHRIVGKVFIDNPLNKKEINHIDGNKLNNKFDNLEWLTPKENSRHFWEKLDSSKLRKERSFRMMGNKISIKNNLRTNIDKLEKV